LHRAIEARRAAISSHRANKKKGRFKKKAAQKPFLNLGLWR
jgi:hypothetical protein